MQIHRSTHASTARLSTASVVRGLLAQPGSSFAAIYRGLTPNLTGNATSWSSFFFFKSGIERAIGRWRYGQSRLADVPGDDVSGGHGLRDQAQALLTPTDFFMSSLLAGALTQVITNPIWVLKTRMLSSDRTTVGADRNMWAGATRLFREEGFRGLYRGLGVSMLAVSHGAVQFAVYEPAKRIYHGSRRSRLERPGADGTRDLDPAQRIQNGATIVLSTMSKVVAGAATYPLQVLRSRLQNYNAEEQFGREYCRQLRRGSLANGKRRLWTHGEEKSFLLPLGGLTVLRSKFSISRRAERIDVEKTDFMPYKRHTERKTPLPGSRYQYHPPKYNRGPLHPVQPLPASDVVSRNFVPGPFNLPRLRETFNSTIASDLMTLTYNHVPPGTPKPVKAERLRSWEGDSPYFANRARRGPRGHPELPIIEKDISFNNIPEIRKITIATFQPQGIKNPDYLVVARTALLALSGKMPEMTESKHPVAGWSLLGGRKAGAKVSLYGNDAYEFLDKVIHLVFPKIKDWPGIRATTGDGSGNIAWGFDPENMQLFPEIGFNLSMYPIKMMPGCRIFVNTTATSDRQARLLMQALGLPFYMSND
ncbi:hypothetical protein P8C59_007978 [Phyllachora maydis]|uniref:Large ribosomal subunit protein uL5 C-terminal domain-containing protein n=1 Tax=Phyllachora maydis TaxID=1825666 RepID=A0AAD9MJ50_9PEZI|nr:hypothetical protein P8C59_007978 [Phyllachora maydis]